MNRQLPPAPEEMPGNPPTEQPPSPRPVKRRWYRDLFLILVVWLAVLGIALPFFYLLRQRGPEMLEKLKQRDPQMDKLRSEALITRGILRYSEGKLEEAGYYLQRAARITPDRPEIYHYLGLTHRDRKEWDQAISSFEEALNLDASSAQTRLELASILATQGKTFASSEILLTLRDLLPDDAPVSIRQDLYAQLIPLAQDLYDDNADYLPAALVLAQYAVEQDNLEEGERLFTQVLRKQSESESALLGLAAISEKREDRIQTVERLADFLKKHPRWIPLYERLRVQSAWAGETAESLTAGLYRPLGWIQPEKAFAGPRRSGMQLIGFDFLPRATLQLNLFDVVLYWQQDRGLVWESEREQPIYRLDENLYAHQSRLFEVVEENLIPNSGFECGRPGANLPAEWPGEFYRNLNPSMGWIQTIEEDLPTQKINRYIRLDTSRLPEVSQVGIYCRPLDVRPNQQYLLAFRYRNRGGLPTVSLRFWERFKRDFEVKRPPIQPQSSDWEIFQYVFRSPDNRDQFNLALSNQSKSGTVDYDDAFLIPLKGLD